MNTLGEGITNQIVQNWITDMRAIKIREKYRLTSVVCVGTFK